MTVIASDAETLQRALATRTVVAYEAYEMALWESGPGGLPVFGHPQVPCVQCGRVTLRFEDGGALVVDTNLDYDEWSLILLDESPANEGDGAPEGDRDPQSIYRRAALEWFPSGRITRVTATADPDRGHLLSISLEFAEGAVSLVAGEFEEQFDGSLRLVPGDESVLLFPSADGIAWVDAQVAKGNLPPITV